jgi:small subunit ribosomal protein S24e
MELEILKERETPLLSRKRVTAEVHYEGKTPSRVDLRKTVSAKIKAPEELVVIRHIYTIFGEQKAKVIVHVYSDPKTMLRLEGSHQVDKQTGKKTAKAAKAEAK